MAPDERRRQLVGIGLRKFVERPVQELSLDEVAAEAGVSRGLLFHYFPTKTDYHRAVVEAARRRVARNVAPDQGAVGEAAVRQVVQRFLDQVARRRESYIALVQGQAPIARAAGDVAARGVREQVTAIVVDVTGIPDAVRPVVHGWVAYLEDRALQWALLGTAERERERADLVEHCAHALDALVGPSDRRGDDDVGAQAGQDLRAERRGHVGRAELDPATGGVVRQDEP